MGKEYTQIDTHIPLWMARQQLFFLATVPTAADGLVNCSRVSR